MPRRGRRGVRSGPRLHPRSAPGTVPAVTTRAPRRPRPPRPPLAALLGGLLCIAPFAPAPAIAQVAPAPPADAAADGGADAGDDPDVSETAGPIDLSAEVDDEAVRAFLQRTLEISGRVENPRVRVEGRFVTLSGAVPVKSDKEWAANLARRVSGVVGVTNEIEVRRAFSAERAGRQVLASVRTLYEDFLEQTPLLLVGLAALLLTGVAAAFARWTTRRTPGYGRLRSSLQDLIDQVVTVTVWVLGFLVAATVAFPGLTPGGLIATLGLGGVAIGFAFKDIFENFLAGIFILWKFPFDRGDFIECEGVSGKIQQITIRNTLIRQPDGVLVVTPNAQLFKNPVEVLTSWKSRRITITAGVAYGEDVDAARAVIETAVKGCDSVETRKPVEAFADEFGASSVNFKVSWWADPTPLGERKSRDQVVAAVKRALDEAGIEIPFPQRTLWFKEALELNKGEQGA